MNVMQEVTNNYAEAIQAIKQAILKSRYNAAALANREMLMLYFGVGEYISKNIREGTWGTNAIETISTQLQKELPGLRGFAVSNINMRQFFEAWKEFIPNRQSATGDLHDFDYQSLHDGIVIRQLPTGDLLTEPMLKYFTSIGFTHHMTILNKTTCEDERLSRHIYDLNKL